MKMKFVEWEKMKNMFQLYFLHGVKNDNTFQFMNNGQAFCGETDWV